MLLTSVLCLGAEGRLVVEQRDSLVTDTLKVKTFFGLNQFSSDNDQAVISALKRIEELKAANMTIVGIRVYGRSSIDGSEAANRKLSGLRAGSVADKLARESGIPRFDIKTEGIGEDWDQFLSVMENSSSAYRDEVLSIIRSGRSKTEKESELRYLWGGAVWKYLAADIFPQLRSSSVIISWENEMGEVVEEDVASGKTEPEQQPEPVPEPEPEPEPQAQPEPTPEPEPAPEPQTQQEQEPEPIPEPELPSEEHPTRFVSVKNNAALTGALISNLGFELGFADHFSFNLPVAFSPYTVKDDWRLRVLALQPEFRWWIRQTHKGLFLGLHGHMAYYNISTVSDKLVRIQDRDGRHPLFGGGLNLGYGFEMGKKKNWGIELSAGGGYARLDYDKFHNLENGAEFDGGVKNYWGLTNAAVNVSYRFAQWNKKKKK